MMDTQYIDIQNVYDYVWKNKPDAEDYEKVACLPPFENIRVVYTDKWNINNNIVDIETKELSFPELLKVISSMNKKAEESILVAGNYNLNEEESYYISTMTFNIRHMGIVLKIGRVVTFFHQNGALLKSNVDKTNVFYGLSDFNNVDELLQELRHDVYMIIFSFCLMHIKNIKLIDKPISRQVRRRKERKGEPFYKVLSLEPFKTQVRNEAREHGETEIQRALHICRGHFVTYSEERPLFGKYSGTYWKPAHMRGSAKHGEVVKDYKIDV